VKVDQVYSKDDGEFLVKLARRTVEQFARESTKPNVPDDTPSHLKRESGVFVTLNSTSSSKNNLRGCIGRPYPTDPLVQATIDSAFDAAANDPRFPPVKEEELDSIIIEVSLLTPPEEIECSNPDELMKEIEVGCDGLIAAKGGRRGLLLPQVAVEWNWDAEEFLRHTCRKAMLPMEAWREPDTKFMKFQAEIFGEVSPRGNVVRKDNSAKQ
jgi:hypothetical protein